MQHPVPEVGINRQPEGETIMRSSGVTESQRLRWVVRVWAVMKWQGTPAGSGPSVGQRDQNCVMSFQV